MHRIFRVKAYEKEHGPHYPQLSVYNPEIFRAAAYGAFAGDTYANYGLSSQCGC